MTKESSSEEDDKLLSQANELVGQTPVAWHKVVDLLDKLRAVVLKADQREPKDQ